jgi:hypothetical protein
MLFTTEKTDIAPKYQLHTRDINNVKDFHEHTSNTISLRALYMFLYEYSIRHVYYLSCDEHSTSMLPHETVWNIILATIVSFHSLIRLEVLP